MGSPELRLLRGWVDCYAHHAQAPLVEDHDEQGRVVYRNLGAEAEYQTLWLREQARLAGQLAVTVRYRDRVPVTLLALFALPSPQGTDQLMGYVDQRGEWIEGLAGLSQQECRALELEMGGKTAEEIRDYMDRRRSQLLPTLSTATTDSYRSRAKRKLRRLFVLEADPNDPTA